MRTEPEDLAYIAGLLDGEGSIQITERKPPTRRTPNYLVHVAIRMTEFNGVDFVNDHFPGNLYKYDGANGYKSVYHYALSGGDAEELLDAMLPYLKVKLPQATVALKLREIPKCKGGTGHYVSEAVVDARKSLCNTMRRLNHGGVE